MLVGKLRGSATSWVESERDWRFAVGYEWCPSLSQAFVDGIGVADWRIAVAK